ncbi:DUF1861 family protein [Halobacillus halophilus]|uniref:DUF1861 family protein n=1 Tax=Halobacillus halophilus TaxID=1570 RepID=UPI001CD21351|nr:DUF1861 family protein [Halobacillus halophilus]MCA1010671.1 DUF1861 family protein [Halobacillus halophilus]
MIYTVSNLLTEYRKHPKVLDSDRILFTGVGERDVYNITAPFLDEGEWVIAARVEGRLTEDSDVIFFVRENDVWSPRKNTASYNLQDPFVSNIHGQLVFGGVKISPHPTNEGALTWKTVFYKGDSINNLRLFAEGPEGMKDIRLLQLEDHQIGVFTRPQGEKGGRGKIGYTEVKSLEQLYASLIENAPLVDAHFTEQEWGGANELHLLENGEIGVLGHIASFDEQGNRHYYPFTCIYERRTNQFVDMKIIATRNDFPEGEAKRPDLQDVLFSGGLIQLEDGKAELYVGVSDAEAHKAVILNPFTRK